MPSTTKLEKQIEKEIEIVKIIKLNRQTIELKEIQEEICQNKRNVKK